MISISHTDSTDQNKVTQRKKTLVAQNMENLFVASFFIKNKPRVMTGFPGLQPTDSLNESASSFMMRSNTVHGNVLSLRNSVLTPEQHPSAERHISVSLQP